ncbi:MAG: transposase [Thermodesulfovibrionia bacterium]|nr:transposase [Thermodesulfovibrionia bacterium]
MRRPQFVKEHVYHVFNRGVDRRDVFLDNQDYYRFIHGLFEFNDEDPVLNVNYYFDPKTMDIGKRPARKDRKPRKMLVEILIFTLMPNHFHLLLKQKAQKGIVKFMHKVGTGYTNYFNIKYEREGVLFQGKFKAVLMENNEQLQYIPQYIHLNPLKLIYGSRTPIDWRKKSKFLEEYRWSSFQDYIGKKNFPSLTQREFLLDVFNGEKNYKKHNIDCLKETSKGEWIESIQDVKLD